MEWENQAKDTQSLIQDVVCFCKGYPSHKPTWSYQCAIPCLFKALSFSFNSSNYKNRTHWRIRACSNLWTKEPRIKPSLQIILQPADHDASWSWLVPCGWLHFLSAEKHCDVIISQLKPKAAWSFLSCLQVHHQPRPQSPRTSADGWRCPHHTGSAKVYSCAPKLPRSVVSHHAAAAGESTSEQ